MPISSLPLNYSNRFGSGGLTIEKPGELLTDIYGLSTVTMVAKCPWTNAGVIPAMFSAHPLYSFTHLERRKVAAEGGFFIIVAEYAGIDIANTAAIYELSLGLGDEPIETHPDFNGFAGSPSAPRNGAIFLDPVTGEISTADNAVFDHFSTYVGGDLNTFAGISSYLDMSQAIWRERYYSNNRPSDISELGKIRTPSGPYPSVGPGNWLYHAVTYEQRGIIYGVTREWRASGRRGWNATIYA